MCFIAYFKKQIEKFQNQMDKVSNFVQSQPLGHQLPLWKNNTQCLVKFFVYICC